MPLYENINWELAECRDVPTNLFYDVEEERNSTAYSYINAVRSYCGKCPIWFDCLVYAFNYESFGVWGGLTSLERKSMYDPRKYPNQRQRALQDLLAYGITLNRILEAYEHSLNDRGLANKSPYHRKNGFVSNSRPR